MTFASDDKYIGYWRDGMRHGKVTIYQLYFTHAASIIYYVLYPHMNVNQLLPVCLYV